MQKSTVSKVKLAAYLAADRQWKREHRIGFARLMLRLSKYKDDCDSAEFYRAVLHANEARNVG